MHIHANCGQVSEKHTSCESGGLIVHDINGKSDARSLVVLSVSQVKSQQVFLVKLVLELGSEVDHEAVLGSGFNGSSACSRRVGEVKSLHGRGILDELVHEAQVVETTRKDCWTNLLGYGRVIKPIGVNWQ